MLNIMEIHDEIEKLENCECTTQDICKKLAILYIVRDHFKGEEPVKMNNVSNNNVTAAMTAPTIGANMVK